VSAHPDFAHLAGGQWLPRDGIADDDLELADRASLVLAQDLERTVNSLNTVAAVVSVMP
jgi:hypothetical protein